MTRLENVLGFTIEIDGDRYDFDPANSPCVTEIGKCRPHVARTLDLEWFDHRRAARYHVDACATFQALLREKYGAKILNERKELLPEGTII